MTTNLPQPLPQPAPKKRNPLVRFARHRLVILAAGVLVGLILAPNGGGNDDDPAPEQAAATSPAPEQTQQAEAEPAQITAKDLTVKVRTTQKNCYGSAGCVLIVEPKVTAKSNQDAFDAGGFEVTIKYTGGTDGPSVETVAIHEGGEYQRPETMLNTQAQGDEVTAKVTEVVYD